MIWSLCLFSFLLQLPFSLLCFFLFPHNFFFYLLQATPLQKCSIFAVCPWGLNRCSFSWMALRQSAQSFLGIGVLAGSWPRQAPCCPLLAAGGTEHLLTKGSLCFMFCEVTTLIYKWIYRDSVYQPAFSVHQFQFSWNTVVPKWAEDLQRLLKSLEHGNKVRNFKEKKEKLDQSKWAKE